MMKNITKNTIKLICVLAIISTNTLKAQNSPPNIILITLDDMNWDSPSVYGGIIPDLTPNIDKLATEGFMFENAYVQTSNCSPSRNVIQTSLYPHQSGVRGFYYVEPNKNTLPEILKNNGFFTGIINKAPDTSLSPDFKRYWDTNLGFKGVEKRSAEAYGQLFSKFLDKAMSSKEPFYCVVNVADPHKPFFNDQSSKKKGSDYYKPSKVYTLNDVKVPEFLPENPKIKQEILNYYNSVKRGDDCVGEVLKALNRSKLSDNTIVILLSDHGMPLPFAKSTVYQNGVRTPLIINWSRKIQKTKNTANLVSAIDLAPTILELVNLPIPKTFEGNSFCSLLYGDEMQTSNYVFAQFDENAGGTPRPSRTVINKKYGYVFNPWATGTYEFKSASASHTSYKTMKNLSNSDVEVKQRFNNWVYRSVEELYDYENDPNALNNLIDNPKYKDVVIELRKQLKAQMIKTNDYVLPAFENKNNIEYLNKWMQTQIKKANARTKSLQWKRFKNNNGPTKNNSELFNIKNKKFN